MISLPMLTLAQAADPKYWIYILFLILLVLLGGGLIMAAKKRLLWRDDQNQQVGGGLMEHLDEMKRTGKITEQEYESTRRSIIEKAAANLREAQDNQQDSPQD